ncbi:MAG: UvrD-helicase domain-containing protein [Candidatus Gracilibacteria bacterium]
MDDMNHPLLSSLNDCQREAVVCTEGPLLVIAGAGSGKTKALTHRIAYLIQEKGVSPWNILAVTFTNKAAKEMKERVAKLIGAKTQPEWMESMGIVDQESGPARSVPMPTMGTFHSICVKLLRKYAHLLDYENQFTIYDQHDQQILMKQLMEEHQIDEKKMNPKSVLGAISGAKSQMIDPKGYYQYTNSFFTEKVAELYEPYQKALRKSGAMDFDDLLMNTVILLRDFPEVLAELQEKFKYIMVDEYQDTNHTQYVLVKLLAAKYRNVCAIGDDDQSIYSWRGATIKNILDFEKDYPETKVVALEQNYRSTQKILDAAHSVISLNKHRKPKKLWTQQDGGQSVKVWMARNERHESEMVGEEILRRLREHENPSYKEFVLLYRTNAQSRVAEEVFLRYAIPYKIIGGTRFYDRKEIRDVMSYLKVLSNPRDSVSLMRIINVPARKIGTRTLEILQTYSSVQNISLFDAMARAGEIPELAGGKVDTILGFVKLLHELQHIAGEVSAAGVIKHVMEDAKYREFLADGTSEGEERLENVRELISVAKKYDGLEPGMSLWIFLEEVSLLSDTDQMEESDNAVTMMTIHAAKGLEFTHVFVLGLEEGIFPSSRSIMEPDQLEEERRLMYVAVTRARERLYLMHAQERLLYGEYKTNAPSQFLDELPESVVEKNYMTTGSLSTGTMRRGSGFDDDTVRLVGMDDDNPGRSRVGGRNGGGGYGGGYGGSGSGFGSSGGSRSGGKINMGTQWDGNSSGSKSGGSSGSEERVVRMVPLEDGEPTGALTEQDRVAHPIFGEGIILSIVGGIVTVVFENPTIGTKKLALSIAPLRKVE